MVQSGCMLAPGTSVGKLTVSNSVALQAGSTTRMEISKTPFTNDQLRATGALTYGGTLVVTERVDGSVELTGPAVLVAAGELSESWLAGKD